MRVEGTGLAVLDSLPAHTAVLDRTGSVVAANRAWVAFASEHPEDPWRPPVGASFLEACAKAADAGHDHAASVADAVQAVLTGRQRAFHIDVAERLPTGEFWFSLLLSPMSSEEGGAILSFTEITSRKRAETLLAHQALHDALTGLPNRTLFLDRLGLALARLPRRPTTLAVLFCGVGLVMSYVILFRPMLLTTSQRFVWFAELGLLFLFLVTLPIGLLAFRA